jgi:CDP-diacylglycerol pyrophosphatase
MARSFAIVLLLGLAVIPLAADVTNCACDPSRPETMKARECSLCNEAEKRPADAPFFILKDVNPRKPNRWLALPRAHTAGPHALHLLPNEARAQFWRYAIQQAAERFGEDWALAYNGQRVRTQCHLHLHIGRWIKAAGTVKFKRVKRIEDFPAPEDSGILVRPIKGGFLVLTGEQIMETALVR